MSWFGGSSTPEPEPISSYDSSSGDNFDSSYASSSMGSSMGSGMTGMDSQMQLRLALQQEQQKAMALEAISKITELCWDVCVSRPDSKLSSSEQSCLSNCSKRYIDTTMFVGQRMKRQAEQAQQHQ
mmetsp:Transcript_15939/g.28377  ORF Transcript_15939/g.28377 Transcript_15939/m.28377 type:complete len:126 (-) Transcript_15939:315-692(-)|eukprot:CAMPEP_0184560266 /NCGR_PEP_ID=MMETSP0199_2-20130426/46849_1 /TAXON_ID=1112570 /ORGANISM="Thraustochytrium sp., Strain LLF1b" /LENGTH=125 /DNA_ID=CAMNT_0026957567 /DNA_START=51 /DNA_END=428 /DNA_ORIENTATION=+